MVWESFKDTSQTNKNCVEIKTDSGRDELHHVPFVRIINTYIPCDLSASQSKSPIT